MPGKRLMCVWSAAAAWGDQQGVTVSTLERLLSRLAAVSASINKKPVRGFFGDLPSVRFTDLETYVFNHLREGGEPTSQVTERIERECWERAGRRQVPLMVRVAENVKFNYWQVFNVLTEEATFPPRIADASWVAEQLSDVLDLPKGGEEPLTGLDFSGFCRLLDGRVEDEDTAVFCVEYLHNLLVLEVLQSGCGSKRTYRQKKWTPWQKRYFVLSSGALRYYDGEDGPLKGEIVMDHSVKINRGDGYKSLLKKYSYSLQISYEKKILEIGLNDAEDAERWLVALEEVTSCIRDNTTPIRKLLAEKVGPKRPAGEEVTSPPRARAVSMEQRIQMARQATVRPGMRRGTAAHAHDSGHLVVTFDSPNTCHSPEAITPEATPFTLTDPSRPFYGASCSHNAPAEFSEDVVYDDDEEFDNNVETLQRDRIKAVFFRIDTDGNGFIDRSEFHVFISSLCPSMGRNEVNQLYDVIKTHDNADNQSISFEGFAQYFNKIVINESDERCPIQHKFASIFTQPGANNNVQMDFRQFVELARRRRRSMGLSRIMHAFDQMDIDKDGVVDGDELKDFLKHQNIPELNTIFEAEEGDTTLEVNEALRNKLLGQYNTTEVSDLAKFLRDRWERFASFKRYGASGQLAMKGESGMVADIIPGVYNLVDLACFDDLPPLQPNYREVKVTWQSSTVPGRSGQLVFPADFDGKLPVEIATAATLRYYGCSFAEDDSTAKVSMMYRSGIQDFSYQNSYLEDFVTAEGALGGSGVEKHEFSHLDCPLQDDNGHFVLGKLENGVLQLTAFRVPRRHTLYIPGGTIHTNDYLKGTWRTMLSDEHIIDHVQLKRGSDLERFTFTFT